jgi:hypothetical protein
MERRNANGGFSGPQVHERPMHRKRSAIAGVALSLFVLSFLGFLASTTWADGGEDPQGVLYPASSLDEAARSRDGFVDQLIDSATAEELPHVGLGRAEARELAEGVFGALLESSAGPFADLQVERFVSDNAAIVDPSGSEAAVVVGGEQAAEEEAENVDGPLLLESTLPLRTEMDSGQDHVVDLDLEPAEGELQPVNPLVDVGIPDELGDGIELSTATLELEASASAEERSPSILGGNVAFYPNVAEDTDFAVATTPMGIETFTQLRSAAAPQSQTFRLDLNADAVLEKLPEGGAAVFSGEEEVLRVMPPTAVDADGHDVPASLEVSGDSLVVSVSADEATTFPVLLDPTVYDLWTWYGDNNHKDIDDNYDGANGRAWRSARNTGAYASTSFVPWGNPPEPLLPYLKQGLTITSGWPAPVDFGAQANWNYYVPRYFSDYEKYGTRPTSFIQTMQMWNLQYLSFSKQGSPWMVAGIWDEQQGKWVSALSRNGYEGSLGEPNWYHLYEFPNQSIVQSAKNVGIALISTEAGANNGRIAFVGSAMVAVSDLDYPTGTLTASKQWVDSAQGAPFGFSFADTGLGVSSVTITDRQAPQHTWATSMSCSGTTSNPCPRTVTSPGTKLTFDPSVLPQGTSTVDVKVADPLGNSSTSAVAIKVDRTAPVVTLGGSITEQNLIGKARPTYTVKLDATDGTAGAPQSGVAATSIKIDGTTVDGTASGCATQSCSVSEAWTLTNLAYAAGPHTVEVIATDAVGRTSSKKLTIELQRDTATPSLSLSGSLKNAPGGWVNQPNYYEVSAVSGDNGFGATALSFEVDKKVINQVTQTCSAGGCSLNRTFTINANSYTGGGHEAAVVAEDGAGNKQRSSWAFKVNVDGVPAPSEVASVSNALIGGTGTASPQSSIEGFPYEPTTAPEDEGESEGVAIAGSGARGGISLTASEGFNLASLSGLPFLMAPIGAGSAPGQAVIGGDAISYPGVWSGIDLLVRPDRNGMSSYMVVHESAALRTVTWEVLGPQPVALTKREDGGVDVTITPSGEVRAFEGREEEETLSDDPQVVASIEVPHVVDGEGTAVPAAFSISGDNVTLTLTPAASAVYPINAGITVQLQGALATWNPLSAADPQTPSEVPVTTIGITSEAGPVGAEWSSNAMGTEVTELRPNANGEIITQTIPISKAYETWIVQAPIEYYAPTSEATPSCIAGFCAGNILCSAVGPQRPFGPPVQTYGLLTCTVQGDQPKDFEYERGGACLQRRFGINGQVLWATEKCHDATPHYGDANWQVAKEVAKACDSGVWRGEAWVSVVTTRAVSTTGSVTANNFKC